MNSNYGGRNKSAVDYLISPWNISTAAQPEEAKYFDGVIGVAFLIGLPLLLFALWKFDLRRRDKDYGRRGRDNVSVLGVFKPAASISVADITFAFYRYLFAAEKAGGILRNAMAALLTAASVAAMLVSFAWFAQRAPVYA